MVVEEEKTQCFVCLQATLEIIYSTFFQSFRSYQGSQMKLQSKYQR